MKEENLNIKKQEWVTPEISKLCLENNEGKLFTYVTESSSLYSYGPS